MSEVQIANEFTRPFEQVEYDKWKEDINNYEKNNIQKLDKIKIDEVNLSQYVNDGSYHSDSHRDYAHSDRAGSYNQTGSSYDKSWYEQGYQHRNTGGTHVNNNNGSYTTTDSSGNTVTIPSHNNYTMGGGYYPNLAHADKIHPSVHERTGYQQTIPHSNSPGQDYGYSRYVPHSDYTMYNQQHVNVENYIPNAPKFFEIEDESKRLFGKVDIRLYSYDANKFGFGSDLEITKKVEYKLEIRKVQNLDGTPNTSGWKVLRDFDMSEVYSFDTLDPLKVGNTNIQNSNGIYEIKATPRNPRLVVPGTPSASYDFIGQSKTISVRIEQNNAPEVTVTNPNEFIKFTFGKSRVKTKDNILKDYNELLYENEPKEMFKGLFVSLDVTDLDLENYIKGSVKIIDKSNNLIATEDIVFSNGENVIKTLGKKQSGYVFFPLEKLLRGKYDVDNIVEITIKDFLDKECTIETKTITTQRNVSKVNPTILNLNVDNLEPKIVATPNTTEWTNKDITLTVSATDESGIEKIIDNENKEYLNQSISYNVGENGTYTFKAFDNLGNINTKSINIGNIDKEPPVINCDLSILGKGKIQVTDNLSGIKSISYKLSNSEVQPTSGFITTSNNALISAMMDTPYIHIKAIDNANNVIIKTFKVNYLKVVATLNPNPGKQGQRVIFTVNTLGFAKELRIEFPQEFKDIDEENIEDINKIIINEQMENIEKINYFIPLTIPLTIDGRGTRLREEYNFIIYAKNKEGVEVNTNVTLDVGGNIYDEIRTRMK